MKHFKPRQFNGFLSPLLLRFWLPWSVFLLLFAAVRIAPPDLAFYYSFGHSFLYDINFYFAPQFAHFDFAPHELYLSAQGLPANDWPMGTGILWTPFLFLASILRTVLNLSGFSIEFGGYNWFDQWVVTFGASLLYGAGTVYASYRLALSHGIKRSSALWACALIAAGSSLTYHLYVNSADSHPPSAFFIALSLLAWQSYKKAPSAAIALMGGAALGVAGLVRPHNLLWGLTPFIDCFINRKPDEQTNFNSSRAAVFVASALLAFLPQMMAWNALYGSWFAVPRSGDVQWLSPHLYEMLFSDFHGMISWSPLFGLGLAGLFTKRKALPYLIPLLLTIYIYSCNIAWWAGGSFGNRRMVSCAPAFILGLAFLFESLPKAWLKGFAIVCAIWTWLLLVAEMGGAIQLDHYLAWKRIVTAIPGGFLTGLEAHVTRIDWGSHAALRIIGAVAVCGALLAAAWTFQRMYTLQRAAALTATGIAFLFIASFAAMLRTPGAVNPDELRDYIPRDRFTWVVYFEKGFYEMQHYRLTDGLESMLAAAITEPSHPQSWMYIGVACREQRMNKLAYFYYREAFKHGARSSSFFEYYMDVLNHMIRTEPTARLYNERGVALGLLKQDEMALADFKLALRIDPDYDTAKANIAIIRQRTAGRIQPLLWE